MISQEKSCSNDGPEKEEEPAIGTYTVTVSPPSITILRNSAPGNITITATCAGEKLPPNCQNNSPGWTYSGHPGVSVLIANTNAPSTTALVIDEQTYNPASSPFYGGDGSYSADIVIRPTNVPNGLTLKGGVLQVVVQPP